VIKGDAIFSGPLDNHQIQSVFAVQFRFTGLFRLDRRTHSTDALLQISEAPDRRDAAHSSGAVHAMPIPGILCLE
jgi:hypothetical protein